MHALDVLGDPVRRRILELLADGEVSAGEVGRIVQAEFGISQPAVSQQLRVLRESGFATVRAEGTRRLYAIDPQPIAEAAQWFTPFERFWRGPLDALGTELARSARTRRQTAANAPTPHGDGDTARAARLAPRGSARAASRKDGEPGPGGPAAASPSSDPRAEASTHPRSRPSSPDVPTRPDREPPAPPNIEPTTRTDKEH